MEEALRKLVDPNNEACCDYHLMAKCKEWAIQRNFKIVSFFGNATVVKTDNHTEMKICWSDTEQQAVFDATSWILNSKELK